MYTVALVDDEQWALDAMETQFEFERFGFEVVLKTTKPADVLPFVSERHVDALICDVSMPQMMGIDLIAKIRQFNTEMKIIILSGYALFEYAKEAISLNVYEYLLKPLNKDAAIDTITRLKEQLDYERGEYDIKPVREIGHANFRKMIRYIDQNLDKKLYLSELAEMFHIKVTYCCYLFNKYYTYGFREYVASAKMKKAAEMLRSTQMRTDEVAEYLAYDYVYFCKLFKRFYGKTPKQYRQENGGKR